VNPCASARLLAADTSELRRDAELLAAALFLLRCATPTPAPIPTASASRTAPTTERTRAELHRVRFGSGWSQESTAAGPWPNRSGAERARAEEPGDQKAEPTPFWSVSL